MNAIRTIVLGMLCLAFAGCDKSNDDLPKIYRFNYVMQIDGMTRACTVNLPPGYYENSNHALVVAMHGGGGSASQFESTSGLTAKANDAGFVVVYPNGTGVIQTWNAGDCCGNAMNEEVDDVRFISYLIDHMVANYKIDPKKVYATGHSNGGMMCYRLACELSHKIAAIAPNGCTQVISSCNPSRPVPVLHMHSRLDQHVPYQGGYGNGVTGIYCTPIDDVLNAWSVMNGCTTAKQLVDSTALYSFYRWTGCNASTIHYYLTEDGGHGWPGGLPGGPNSDTPSTAIDANDLIWAFFQQYQLP